MNGKRRLQALAVTLAVALGGTAAFAADVPADVQGTDCEAAVTKLVSEKIVTGDTDGLYHPQKNLTRAEVSTLIAKAVDPTAADSTLSSGFLDMNGYGWAEPFVGLMADKGIAKGYPDGTFQPGADVKVSELAAFVIRACGIGDGDLSGTWPQNYMNKADEMDLFDAVKGDDQTSMLDPNVPATKEQAAIAVYNALERIRSGEQTEPAEPTVPDTKGYTFAKLSFNDAMTQLNGISLAKDVKVVSYGKAKDYSKSMELPDVARLEAQNPIKYKGVSTEGFYKTANGAVTEVILPADQGYSGRVYGYITGYSQTVNVSGDTVCGIDTVAAGQEIYWICKKDVTASQIAPFIDNIAKGDLVEMTMTKGQVKDIQVATAATTKAKHFEEFSKGDWATVTEKVKNKGLFKLDADPEDPYVAYADNVVVYVLNDKEDGYDVGSVSSIKKGDLVRCYDITDDDEPEANIIFVKQL